MNRKKWMKENAPSLLKKNIIIVTPELKSFKARSGGLGPAVEELAEALADFGLKVYLISPLYQRVFYSRKKTKIDYSDVKLEDVGKVNVRVAGENSVTYIKKSNVGKATVYLLQNEKYADTLYYGDMFTQCIFLARGTLETLKKLKIKPHIIHLNDAHTGLIPIFLKADPPYQTPLFKNVKIVFTVHNAGLAYQQTFNAERFDELGIDNKFLPAVMWNGNINLTYAVLNFCDRCNTVSKDYEITLKYDGEGLRDVFKKKNIFSIVNGIDINYWRMPELKKKKITKSLIKKTKGERKKELIKVIKERTGKTLKEDKLLIVMPRRLADQKGFDKILSILPQICREVDAQLILLGMAHPNDNIGNKLASEFEKMSKEIQEFVFIFGFDEELAKLMYWGGDLLLYPSVPNKEPCGTGYMMAAVSGTPTLGTKTGGLAEKIVEFNPITERGNGFLVWEEEYSSEAFLEKLKLISNLYYKQPKKWLSVCFNAVNMEVDITRVAMEYILRLYKPLFKKG